jgi:hypothetical protein
VCGSTGEDTTGFVCSQECPKVSIFIICLHNLITISNSQASKAVDAWKADFKKRPKIAASLAHPDMNPELFEEG